MADRPQVEDLGQHNYLVRVIEGEDTIEIRVHVSRETVARMPADADERRVVEVTAAFLFSHQRADDLPATLDLDDVAAAYDDYFTEIGRLLASST